MKTSGLNFKTSSSFLILLLSIAILQSSCSDISTGEALGVVFGLDSSGTSSEECEIDNTQSAVKWEYDFNGDNLNIAGDVAGVVMVYGREASADIELKGFEKESGRLLWTQELPNVFGINPNAVSRTDDLFLHKKDKVIILDAATGVIKQQLALPFVAKEVINYQENFYFLPDPCVEDVALGIYKWKSSAHRNEYELVYDLEKWSAHNTHLSNLIISSANTNQPILILGAAVNQGISYTNEILAISLESERLLWTEVREGNDTGFGFNLGYQLFEDKLLVGRRRALTMLSVESGEVVWETSFGESGFFNSQAYFQNGKLFIHDNYQAKNFCFDVNDGRVLWNYFASGKFPVYFKGEQMIWGGLEGGSSLAYVSKDNGSVIKSLEHPWDNCPYAYFEFLTTAQDHTNTIIAYDADHLFGLGY